MKANKGLHMVTFILLVVGGLNWLLLGVSGWEIGELFGGSGAWVSRIIYILVGLSALYELLTHKQGCCVCGKCECSPKNDAPMPEKPAENKQQPPM